MTIGELMELMKGRDPSEIVCIRLLYGHGDNTTHFVEDDVAFGIVAVPGDPDAPAHALMLLVDGEGGNETQVEEFEQ